MIFMLTWKKVISIKGDGDDDSNDPVPWECSLETGRTDGLTTVPPVSRAVDQSHHSPSVMEWLGSSKTEAEEKRMERAEQIGGDPGCANRQSKQMMQSCGLCSTFCVTLGSSDFSLPCLGFPIYKIIMSLDTGILTTTYGHVHFLISLYLPSHCKHSWASTQTHYDSACCSAVGGSCGLGHLYRMGMWFSSEPMQSHRTYCNFEDRNRNFFFFFLWNFTVKQCRFQYSALSPSWHPRESRFKNFFF